MLKDPRSGGPRPPFSLSPLLEHSLRLDPVPDYGEQTYRGCGRLEDCVAIVVGGDSGIGRAVAIAFAREGADVFLSGLEEEEVRETAHWVRQAGRRVNSSCGDVRDHGYRDELVARAIAEFGHFDILVNDALSQWAPAPLETLDLTVIEQTIRTTAESVLLLAEAVATKMKPGSSIINTATARSSHSLGELRVHASSKNAITNGTASLAERVAITGIRVNAVAPGPVWAPRPLWALEAKERSSCGSGTFLGRPAQPAELASAYVFLASNAATFITGTALAVDGGWIERSAPM